MRSERTSIAIIGGVVGGAIVGLLSYSYVVYKLNRFGDSSAAKQGIPVTIPGSAVTDMVRQWARASDL